MAQSRTVVSRGMLLAVGAVAVTTLPLFGTAIAAPLTIGPAEQVNVEASTVVVLGQTYHVNPSLPIINRSTGAQIALGSIAPGTLVLVDANTAIDAAGIGGSGVNPNGIGGSGSLY